MIRDNTRNLLDRLGHQNKWLLDKWHIDLETQINVRAGSADEADSDRVNMWSNGVHTWKHIRWPYNAKTTPNFRDFEPQFPLSEYAEFIGTTWWNWKTKESEAVVFDFDSIKNHASGLLQGELDQLLDRLLTLDYVTVYRSRSGNGFHVLVCFEKGKRPSVQNHDEHSDVAKVTLDKMGKDLKIDFTDKVDCYGMIGWIWSTKTGDDGFEMIQVAERDLTVDDIDDWTLLPSKRLNKRPKIVAYNEDGQEIEGNHIIGFDQEEIALDKVHIDIITALENSGWSFSHVQEHNLFHTHTAALRKVHRELSLKGPFATIASGEGNEKPNCFIRPLKGGGFAVYRFGKGVPEHQIWDQSKSSTWCTFNQGVPPHKIIVRMGGEYIAEKKHYEFDDHEMVMKCCDVLGNRVPLKLLEGREYAIGITGRGCVVKCYCENDEKPGECDGWQRVRGYFKKVLTRLEELDVDSILTHVDQVCRFTVRDGKSHGWVSNTAAGWTECSESEAKRITRHNVGGQEATLFMDIAAAYPWTMTSEPFKPEVLPGRKWNRGAAQLVAQCATRSGPHPHWDKMLAHIGQSWDDPIAADPFMQKYGIFDGADYLRAWIACTIRHPESPLPYIFLVGPQNTGKSLCHEVLRECIVDGVVHGGPALVSAAAFNGELEGKVLAAIDELDLSEHKHVAARVKAWTNSTYFTVHRKGHQPYDIRNYLHFMQSANEIHALPIEQGDTRVAVGWVPRFTGVEIPKEVFIQNCIDELPNFLYTLGTMRLPPTVGRTRLPVVSTEIKEEILDSTTPPVLEFIRENYFPIDGQYVPLKEAYDAYSTWAGNRNDKPVSLNEFKMQLAHKFPVYKGPRGRTYSIGNLSIDKNATVKEPFSMSGNKGRHERCTT